MLIYKEGNMALLMKRNKKILYVLMLLLLIFQSILPTVTFLRAYADDQPDIFRLINLSENSDKSLTLNIATHPTDTDQTVIINYQNLAIQKATLMNAEGQKSLVVNSSQSSIEVPIKASPSEQTQSIHLEVSDRNDSDIPVISYHSQHVQLSQSEEKASTQEESSKTASVSSEVKNTQPITVTSAAPQDIRTYFPSGKGTILTGAKIEYLDTDGNTITSPLPIDAIARVHYDWKIPEDIRKQIRPGDHFDFQLPEQLKPNKALSGNLKSADGTVYATYTVDETGKIQFVFNENVSKVSDITGNFFFDTHFDQSVIPGPGDTTIIFPEEDNIPPSDVVIKPKTDTSIHKSGEFDRTPNPSAIKWTVDFNQSMASKVNPKITEHWPEGNTYQSVKVYRLKMNFDGTVKSVEQALDPSEYTVDSNGNVTIHGETNDAYRLVYETAIDDKIVPKDGGKISFTNQATLTDDEDQKGIDTASTITNEYGKLIDKKKTGYDPNNQTFSWEIKYNYGEKTIPVDQAILTDKINGNMSLIDPIELHEITFDKDGNEQVGRLLSSPEDYQIEKTSDGKQFVIKFNQNIKTAVKINYQTKVDGVVDDPTEVNNTVETNTGEESSDGGTATQQNVTKSLGQVDYKNGTADWQIHVNKNHYEMNDIQLKDNFHPVPGITMKENANGYVFKITDVDTGKVLVNGTDYQLEINQDANKVESGFSITFIGDYAKTSDHFVIDYQTEFDITIIDPDDPKADRFNNQVSIDWQDTSNNKHSSEDSTDFKPNYDFANNASKSGEYNAQTKEITWKIAVNLSGNPLTDAFLKDKILPNQKYVANSLAVYSAQTQSDGTVVKTSPNPINGQMRQVEEPSSANDETFLVAIPNQSSQTYLIEFKTSLADKVIEDSSAYNNTAEYSNSGQSRDVTGKVSIKNGGSYIQKEGEQDPTDLNYVNWQAIVNPSLSTLDHVVITDIPSSNQSIDESSIKLYGTTIAADGTISVNHDAYLEKGKDYTVTLETDNLTGKQKLSIQLLHEIDTAYSLAYRSFITSSTNGNKDTVSNAINITGDGSKQINGQDTVDTEVQIDHSGGNASGKTGSITLKKTAEDGKTVLKGAVFQLWNLEKTQLLRTGETSETGLITFGALPQGDYLLVETKAPLGYTMSDDLVKGTKITINDATSEVGATPLTIKNTVSKVIVVKTNAAGDKLMGAQFKLEHLNHLTQVWTQVPLANFTTAVDGTLEIDALEPGDYRVTEIASPKGYLINSEPVAFSVIATENGQIPLVTVPVINYQGSASLVKTDDTGKALAGAEFKVINDKNEVVKTGLISDNDGGVKIDQLAPGHYQFVETKAPIGYILNTEPVGFDIAQQAEGIPATVIATNHFINYQGSAELIKTDASGKPLAGATFKVLDDQGQVIKDGLISDASGKVLITDLSPGSYQFVETNAPSGYVLNNAPIHFEINSAYLGEPAVVNVGAWVNQAVPGEIDPSDSHQQTGGAQPANQTNQTALPSTNSVDATYLSWIGLTMIGLTLFWVHKRSIKR